LFTNEFVVLDIRHFGFVIRDANRIAGQILQLILIAMMKWKRY